MTPARFTETAPPSPGPVTVVGIGADGWSGLASGARRALTDAEVVIGARRQLALLPGDCVAHRVGWPTPLRPAVAGLLAEYQTRRLCVLASGDPMFFGIGRTLVAEAPARGLRVLPHPSSATYACARLGWPVEDTEVVSLVGRPTSTLAAVTHHGRRLLVLSAGAETPAEVAKLLTDNGFGPSRLQVLEQLGGAQERQVPGVAREWSQPPGDPLNLVAVECRREPWALRLPITPGLPDDAFEHDGQLTKRQVRAATLAALAPEPGETLWDVGGGSGSVSIEWMRAHRGCRAVAVERDPTRAARLERNAAALGVPALRVVTGTAPAALVDLPPPDAVFVGGGLTTVGLVEACWDALPVGGRLVANTVTLESEALLAGWYRRHGGELTRIAVSRATAVGGFTGWRPAMPVTQWSVVKPHGAPARWPRRASGDPGVEGEPTAPQRGGTE